MPQLVDTDDATLLHRAVQNIGTLGEAIDSLAAQVAALPDNIALTMQYDDRIARGLEAIADTLARLERQ